MAGDNELTGAIGPEAEVRKLPLRPWVTPRVIVSEVANSQRGGSAVTGDVYTIAGSPFYQYIS